MMFFPGNTEADKGQIFFYSSNFYTNLNISDFYTNFDVYFVSFLDAIWYVWKGVVKSCMTKKKGIFILFFFIFCFHFFFLSFYVTCFDT